MLMSFDTAVIVFMLGSVVMHFMLWLDFGSLRHWFSVMEKGNKADRDMDAKINASHALQWHELSETINRQANKVTAMMERLNSHESAISAQASLHGIKSECIAAHDRNFESLEKVVNDFAVRLAALEDLGVARPEDRDEQDDFTYRELKQLREVADLYKKLRARLIDVNVDAAESIMYDLAISGTPEGFDGVIKSWS